MKYTIIVDKQSKANPSADKRTYEVEIEELRTNANISDSLVISGDETYVLRRLKLTEFNVLEELEESIKEPINDIDINLFEGDNYIYLANSEGNTFYAEYLIKNDFNAIYVSKNEMTAAINSNAQNIILNVNQKLEGYSTTEQMNAAIKLKANEINQEVAKKVDGEDYTAAQILLRINEDTSEAKIKADKISLEGKTLNLAEDMEIKSKNFNVSSDGTMICKNGKFSGTLENGGNPSSGEEGMSIDKYGKINCTNLRIYDNSDAHSGIFIHPSDKSSNNKNIKTQMLHDGIEIQDISTSTFVDLIHLGVFTNTGSPYLDMKNAGLLNIPGGKLQIQDIVTTGYGMFGGYVSGESIINRSEEKLKTNISKLTDKIKKKSRRTAIQMIQNTDIYEFNYLGQQEKTFGLVIGEKYNTPTELIKSMTDEAGNESKGIDLYSMISIAYKAIQEIEADREKDKLSIKKLTERIAYLEGKINEKNT